MTLTVNKMRQIKIQTTVEMFYFLEICHLLGCINHRINCIRTMTFKYDS